MLICPRCGTHNYDGTYHCTRCNTPFLAQPIYVATPVYEKKPVPGRGLGVASMVLGILSIVLFCVWFLSIPFAVLGLIFGIAGLCVSKSHGNGMAVAGFVCSLVTLLFYGLIIFLMAEGGMSLYEYGRFMDF